MSRNPTEARKKVPGDRLPVGPARKYSCIRVGCIRSCFSYFCSILVIHFFCYRPGSCFVYRQHQKRYTGQQEVSYRKNRLKRPLNTGEVIASGASHTRGDRPNHNKQKISTRRNLSPQLIMSESQPLLSQRATTPLPKLQLFLLFFIRMTDPVAFNCIFPFVQQMLLDIGAVDDPDKVGYYAGMVSQSFLTRSSLVTMLALC
jgi:hypothetical protein